MTYPHSTLRANYNAITYNPATTLKPDYCAFGGILKVITDEPEKRVQLVVDIDINEAEKETLLSLINDLDSTARRNIIDEFAGMLEAQAAGLLEPGSNPIDLVPQFVQEAAEGRFVPRWGKAVAARHKLQSDIYKSVSEYLEKMDSTAYQEGEEEYPMLSKEIDFIGHYYGVSQEAAGESVKCWFDD